jgi:hypothetical protein
MLSKLLVVLSATVLAGCTTTNTLFVGTYTRAGIDVSQETAGGGIGVKNAALTIAPTKTTGEPFDVLGTSDIDLSFTDVALNEVVATGTAAVCASGVTKKTAAMFAAEEKARAKTEKEATGPLIFAAVTSWSLIEVNAGQVTGPGVSFGYKRTVGIRMPVKEDKIGATFATVAINTKSTAHANGAPKSELDGIRSVYTFSTGEAAINMARKYADQVTGKTGHTGCPES